MRDILFRGKRKDTGEWVYGFYSVIPLFDSDQPIGFMHVIYDASVLNMPAIEVIPETVGQYIDRHDSEGKGIYEGDIVDSLPNGEVVEFKDGGFSPFMCLQWECTPLPKDIEIIGNIHDNPELLIN